jgi:DNA-binding CsgD family transcriptional regulator
MMGSGGLEFFGKAAHLFTRAQWQLIVDSLRLSAREAQILLRVFDNQKNIAIAMDLGISAHTVHTYFERMYRKLGVQDRCDLVVRVFETHMALRPLETYVRFQGERSDDG